MNNPNIETFLEHVRSETSNYGIKLQLRDSRHVDCDGMKVNGYFDDEETKSLVVAAKQENWLEILVHEYSHFEQWKDKAEAFMNLEGTEIIDYWLNGEEYELETIHASIQKLRDMEHDCEKRAAGNIRMFNLPINLETYSQKANAYAHFYNWMEIRRRWYKIGKEPYNIPEILEAMNPEIDKDVSKTPDNIISLFDKHL